MFKTIIKYLAMYYLNNMISSKANSFMQVKDNAADYVESRAIFFKYNLLADLRRVVNSFFVYLAVFFAFVFSGFIGLMWLFSTIAESQNRDLILGIMVITPIIIAVVLLFIVTKHWKENPFINESTRLIAYDWNTFRYGTDSTPQHDDKQTK
jgi:hypothetical protein